MGPCQTGSYVGRILRHINPWVILYRILCFFLFYSFFVGLYLVQVFVGYLLVTR